MHELFFFDFDEVPDIYTEIHHIQTEIHTEPFNVTGDDHTVLVIILSGSGEYTIHNNEKQTSPTRRYTPNFIFSLNKKQTYLFTPTTRQSKVIIISLTLYAVSRSDESGFREDEPAFKCAPFVFFPVSDTISSYSVHNPMWQNDFSSLELALEQNSKNEHLIRRCIEKIILTLMYGHFTLINSVIHKVDAVAITNIYKIEDTPFSLSIGNVEIYDDDPAINKNAKLLESYLPIHKYIERPDDASKYHYEISDEENQNHCTGTFDVDSSSFKLWLFPAALNSLSIVNCKQKFTVLVKLKCSQACSLQLFLYSLPTYQSFSYTITIDQPRIWKSVSLSPISSNPYETITPYAAKAIEFIQKNYRERITIKDVAEYVHIHSSYLSAVFSKSTHQTINGYINFYRITMAKQLLLNTEDSVTSIAVQTGFYDGQHFLKTFKKVTGMTPSKFRQSKTER